MIEKVLTISVAAYNVGKYIRETLTSLVIKKNLDKLEVLIVDDGSTDSTAEIAQEFVEKYPYSFFYFKKTNGGHGSTINFAITRATGKYFKVLDGDDSIATEQLDCFIEYLGGIDCDLVLSDQIFLDVKKNAQLYKSVSGIEPLKVLKTSNLFVGSDCLLPNITIKTEKYRQGNYVISEGCFYDDLEWNYNCIRSTSDLVYWNKGLYLYTIGRVGQSVSLCSRQKNYKMLRNITISLSNRYKNDFKLNWFQKECLKSMIAGALYGTFIIYLSFHDTRAYEKELESFVKVIDVDIKKYCKSKYLLFNVYCLSKRWYRVLSLYYRYKKGIMYEGI